MIAEIFAGLSIASSVLGGVAAIRKGNVERQIHQDNARLADLNATFARGAAVEQRRQIRFAAYKTTGTQKTAYARGGVNVSEGSPADVMQETQNQFELDLFKADLQGQLSVTAYKEQARILRRAASAAQTTGVLSAVAGITGGTLQSLGTLYRGSAPGNPNYIPPTLDFGV